MQSAGPHDDGTTALGMALNCPFTDAGDESSSPA